MIISLKRILIALSIVLTSSNIQAQSETMGRDCAANLVEKTKELKGRVAEHNQEDTLKVTYSVIRDGVEHFYIQSFSDMIDIYSNATLNEDHCVLMYDHQNEVPAFYTYFLENSEMGIAIYQFDNMAALVFHMFSEVHGYCSNTWALRASEDVYLNLRTYYTNEDGIDELDHTNVKMKFYYIEEI